METVSYLVVSYLVIGIVSTGAVFFFEEILTAARGPEYRLWLMKVASGQKLKISNLVKNVLFWPMVIALWLIAVKNKRTLIEEITVMEERLAKRKAEASLQLANNWPPRRFYWMTVRGKERKNKAYVRMALFPRGGFLTIHAITDCNGFVVCWRAVNNNPDHNMPLQRCDTVAEAKKVCEADTEWLELCNPARLGDRLRYLVEVATKVKAAEDTFKGQP